MSKNSPEAVVRGLLVSAEVSVNGSQPYDIRVHDDRLFRRILRDGALGLGESYMDGWWDCEALDQFIDRVLRSDLEDQVKNNMTTMWYVATSRIFNLQKSSRALQVGEQRDADV